MALKKREFTPEIGNVDTYALQMLTLLLLFILTIFIFVPFFLHLWFLSFLCLIEITPLINNFCKLMMTYNSIM